MSASWESVLQRPEAGPSSPAAAAVDQARVRLLRWLKAQDYRFVPPTPLTHRRVYPRRAARPERSLADVFGWNLAFAEQAVAPELFGLMQAAAVLHREGGSWRSDWRVASLDDLLFWHSGFPTTAPDAVFFGPDTYRFLRFLQAHLAALPPQRPLRVLDVGCGSGAGGIMVARRLPSAMVTLGDINPLALCIAAINAVAAGVTVRTALGDALAVVEGELDLVICNPPYLVDAGRRAYRHGGDDLGRELGLRIAREALARLAPGGRLLLYTGVAIEDGRDAFIAALAPALEQAGCDWRYEEIDPDVFGEELQRTPYLHTDRIAAIGLAATRR